MVDVGNQHRFPVEEFVQATRGTPVQVLAQNLGLFMQRRPRSARVLWNERDFYSPEMCRATAASHWRAGVDGIYLFNNHIIEFDRDARYGGGEENHGLRIPDLTVGGASGGDRHS